MGILRSDRVSGLGGANAIKGSVEFRAAQNIRAEIVNGNADFNLGSGDFTIECWWNSGGDLSTDINFITLWNYSSNRQAWGMYWDADDGNFGLIASTGGSIGSTDITYRQAANFAVNTWYHLAIVRISNTLTLYKDGTSIGSNSSFTGTIYENTVDPLVIGGQLSGTSYDSKIMRGFLSNVRVIKGEGIYTGAFTPPTNELTVTPNTVLLACQSPGNILQEATGKTLVAYRKTANDAFPFASRFVPDVGEDYGTTFGEKTVFDTLSYMVPPGGTTTQSNRGRALIAGGTNGGGWGTKENTISYIQIQSGGIAKDFGDLSSLRSNVTSVSSSTRAVFGGGSEGASANNAVNTIEYVTIATSSNVTNFGDLTSLRRPRGGVSNNTRGLFGGGYIAPANKAEVDHVTIASTGDATDFGDLSVSGTPNDGSSNSTRGVWMGGGWGAQIEYVTIASTGSGADFGNIGNNRTNGAGASSSTRALLAGGGSAENAITYITIASLGNDTDFGDLTVGRRTQRGTSNGIRGIFCGGYTPDYDIIDSVIIATTGNAVNYGDLTTALREPDACSDSHGGIS